MADANAPTVEEIKQAYKDAEINARQYHQKMWLKSRDTFEQQVLHSHGKIGAVQTVINQVWKDWKTRYEEIQQFQKSREIQKTVEAGMKQTGGQMPETIYATPESFGEFMWKNINAVMAPLNRTGELGGIEVKKIAKSLGAPDWMASLMGFAGEVGTQFLLSGKPTVQAEAGIATGVKAAGRAVKNLAAKPVKTAEGAAAIPEEAAKIIQGIDQGVKDVFTSPKESAAVSAEVMKRGKDFLASKKPYQMSEQELNAAYKTAKASEEGAAVKVFGEEQAKKYEKLQRTANSSNASVEAQDAASAEIAAMEGKLTESQKNNLYGIGQQGPGADEYKDYLDAVRKVGGETPQELGQSLKYALTKVGSETDPAKMNYGERVAYAQIQRAYEIAKEKGFDTKIVSQSAIQSAGARFSNPEDAQFMLDRFLKKPTAIEGMAQGGQAEQAAQGAAQGKHFEAGQQAVEDIAKYDNPLQAAIVNFQKSSEQQARGMARSSGAAHEGMRRTTHAATMERAAALPVQTLESVGGLPPGTVLNAEQIVTHQAAFKEGMAQLLELAPQVVEGDPTAAIAFDAINMRLLNPLKTIEAVKTETGRATEILKATTPIHETLSTVHDIYAGFGPESAAVGNWDGARARLAAKLMSMGTAEDIGKTYDLANANLAGEKGKTVGDLFRQGYTAILLAKPATWVKKSLGDVQGAFDKTLQYSFGSYVSDTKGAGLLNGEGPLAARVMTQSLMHNMGFTVSGPMQEAFNFAVKGKDIPAEMAKFVGKRQANTMSGFFDYGGDPERWNIPGKVFDNITSFAQNTGSTFGMYMNAHREAIKLGMGDTPAILNEFVANRMAYPTKDMLMEGINAAGEMTYTNPMGALGHAVQKAVQGWPGGWLITPFFHIPANIVNRAFSNIPVVNLFTKGVVKDLEAGGVERDLQLGRLAMAQVSSQFLWLMSKGGMSTGNGPLNQKERQIWLAAGNHPNSFHFGNTWIPHAFLGSLGIQASIIADAAYISDYFDQPSIENVAGSLTIASAQAIANEPFFESWGRFSRAMQDPEKSGLSNLGKALGDMALTPASVLTGGPVVATMARALDPFSKSVDNVLDDIKQTIPLVRDGVPNALNPLTGEKNPLPAPWGAGWLRDYKGQWARYAEGAIAEVQPMQFWESPVSTDPVIKEMLRVGAEFPNFRVNYGSQGDVSGAAQEPGKAPPVNLTAAEAEDFIKNHFSKRLPDDEKTVRELLLETINDPDWNDPENTRFNKKKTIESILRGNNAGAFQEFKAVNPSIAYRYAASGLGKILAGTSEAEKAATEQEYLQGQNEALQSTNEDLRNQNTQIQIDAAEQQYQQSQPQPPSDLSTPSTELPTP